MTVSIKIDPSCSDDNIQAQLLRCIFILRHRQNTSKSKYLDPIANDTKWEVFWGAVSRYSLSIVRNEDGEYNDFLTNYSLLYKNEDLNDWENDTSCSLRNELEVSVSTTTSEWLPRHCFLFNFAGSDEYSKVLSLACIQSPENIRAVNNIETPLHLAVAVNNPNLKIIKNLLKYFSSMTSMETDNGEIPLHYAARNSNNIEVIELLIEAYPQGLEKECKQGEVPMFKALGNGSDNTAQIVQRLLQASPHSVKSINKKGQTPLHAIVLQLDTSTTTSSTNSSVPVDIIKTLLIAYPQNMTIQDNDGNTPLHILCYNNTLNTEDFHSILQLMLKIDPTVASILNKYQQTSLHILICHHNGHRKDLNILVPILLDVYPEAVSVTDTAGYYLIHCAVMNRLNITLMELIINLNPAALLELGTHECFVNAMTPIQLSIRRYNAAKFCDELIVLKYLFSKCPESVHIRSGCSDSLLHIAVKHCSGSQRDKIVKAVYHMDPSSAMRVNSDEETPLLTALKIALNHPEYPFHCLRFLSQMCPAAITVSSYYGMSPLDEVMRYHRRSNKNDVLYRLLLQAMPGVDRKEELYRLNYEARRMAMFLFFKAIFGENNDYNNNCEDGVNNQVHTADIFIKLRNFDSGIVRRIILLL